MRDQRVRDAPQAPQLSLVKCGYQVDQTMVRMQKGKQEDYEDPADLVLDDWR